MVARRMVERVLRALSRAWIRLLDYALLLVVGLSLMWVMRRSRQNID